MERELSWPVVRPGHENHPTKTICLLLRAQATEWEQLAGYSELEFDKGYTDQAVEGIRILQRAVEGIAVDGIVGNETWPCLIKEVRQGSVGPAVLAVQWEYEYRDMSDGEGPGLARDSIFGPKTGRWIRGFQQYVPLEDVDGIVGQETWHALVSGALAG